MHGESGKAMYAGKEGGSAGRSWRKSHQYRILRAANGLKHNLKKCHINSTLIRALRAEKTGTKRSFLLDSAGRCGQSISDFSGFNARIKKMRLSVCFFGRRGRKKTALHPLHGNGARTRIQGNEGKQRVFIFRHVPVGKFL